MSNNYEKKKKEMTWMPVTDLKRIFFFFGQKPFSEVLGITKPLHDLWTRSEEHTSELQSQR